MDGVAIRSLIEEYGREAARGMVPGRSGPRAVEAAAGHMAAEGSAVSFVYSGWCQTALPHRRRPDDEIWKVEAERVRLLVEPDAQADGARVGVPYGPTARLILIYLQSEALRTNCREVEIGGSLRAFLGRVGVSVGGKTAAVVKDQAERISRCRLSFHWAVGKSHTPRPLFAQTNIVECGMLAELDDEGRQGRLFVDRAVLSEPFFRALRDHAVPLDEAAVAEIKTSSVALDVYCWLAFRLHHLDGPKPVSWTALRAQFGTGFKRMSAFKESFREGLRLANVVYPQARFQDGERNLTLLPSPPPVARRK